MKKQNFNMIEIILAMAIILVAMTTLIGIFPIGIDANQDAKEENYMSAVIEQFNSYLDSHNPTISATSKNTSSYAETAFTTSTGTTDFLTNVKKHPSVDVYKIDFKTTINPSDGAATRTDFSVIASVWRDTTGVPNYYTTANSGANVSFNVASALYVYIEYSWPANIPYAQRTKRLIKQEFTE